MFAKCSFFFTHLSQRNFLYCPRFFILNKILNTDCTPTEMKQNLLHEFSFIKIFVNFVKLLNISLNIGVNEYSVFFSLVK